LHGGQGLTEGNAVNLRVDGAMTLSRAVVVRRVDDEWGRQGGAIGSYFNDRSSWAAKVDFPAGPHEIEASYKDIRGVVFSAVFEPGATYGIATVDAKPNCLQLTKSSGTVVQEQCYVDASPQSCSAGQARLTFNMKEAKQRTGKEQCVILQKVDSGYGPSRAGLGWGLNFYNDAETRDLDVRVCAGQRTLVLGVEVEGYQSMRPIPLKADLEANATYRIGLLDDGVEKKSFFSSAHSPDFSQVLVYLEKVVP
jgi:hypothetical protein